METMMVSEGADGDGPEGAGEHPGGLLVDAVAFISAVLGETYSDASEQDFNWSAMARRNTGSYTVVVEIAEGTFEISINVPAIAPGFENLVKQYAIGGWALDHDVECKYYRE